MTNPAPWEPPSELVEILAIQLSDSFGVPTTKTLGDQLIESLCAAHAAGWRFVPAEPTKEMCGGDPALIKLYKAMIAASESRP